MSVANTLHAEKINVPLVASFFLSIPALIAFGAALSLAHEGASLLPWLLYEASRQIGFIGIAVMIVMAVVLAIKRASRVTILWITTNIGCSAVFLWWAHHLALIS